MSGSTIITKTVIERVQRNSGPSSIKIKEQRDEDYGNPASNVHSISEDEFETNDQGIFLVRGPFGMEGLVNATPRHGVKFSTFFDNTVFKWAYIGDYTTPSGMSFSQTYLLTAEFKDDSGAPKKIICRFFAPRVGLIYAKSHNVSKKC
jgi:hypothetical protein